MSKFGNNELEGEEVSEVFLLKTTRVRKMHKFDDYFWAH